MRARAAAAALALALAAAASAGVPTAPRVAVLGDSYASGEGLPAATGPCGTEDERSWGALLAADLGASDLQLLACSGATLVAGGSTRDLPAQLEEVVPAELVLLVIGGNDLGFVDIVADCLGFADLENSPVVEAREEGGWTEVVATGALDRGCDVPPEELLARVEALRAPLRDAYLRTVEAAVAEGGRLLVVGYPALFEDPDRWAARYGQRCHGVRAEDVRELDAVVDALDALLADVVGAVDAELGGGVLTYVPLTTAYDDGDDDHRLCGAGEPWMNGLTVVEGGVDVVQLLAQLQGGLDDLDLEALGARPSGSFHPGTAGHRGTADLLLEQLAG